MVAITPKTPLEAVNTILRNMSEAPVNSLSGDLPLEASQAYETLLEVSMDVQVRGWFFNREYYTLSPDVDGYISLPANTLSVKSIGTSRGTPVTNRGGRLYNMTPFSHGFTWDGPVQLRVILGLDFEVLPASARRYITLRAAAVFQVRELGDQMNAQEDSQEAQRALADLHSEQLRNEPTSLEQTSSVRNILSRDPIYSTNINY